MAPRQDTDGSEATTVANRSDRATQPDATTFPRGDWALAFLDSFRRCGVLHKACKRVRIGRVTVFRRRKADPEFARRYRLAKREAVERGEAEMIRRAVDGVRKPVYQGGRLVGHVREYSDGLLKFFLAANDPKYARKSTLTVEQGSPQVDAEEQRRLMASPEYREMACRLTELRAALLAEPQALEGPTIDVTPDPPTTREDGGDT